MGPGYVLFAGPQAAGKSTAIEYAANKYQCMADGTALRGWFGGMDISLEGPDLPVNLVVLQEMRQVVLRERRIPGGRFMDWSAECEVIRRDIKRMEGLSRPGAEGVYLDETSVFTLAHAKLHGVRTAPLLDRYKRLLDRLGAVVIFMSVGKDVSWSRRKPRYEERVVNFPVEEKSKALMKYREYLDEVYDNLFEVYGFLDLEKIMIDASGSLEGCLRSVKRYLSVKETVRGIRLVERL
jgi:hypothetical protein